MTTIRELMGPAGTPWVDRASTLSVDQKYELSGAVDELAHWATRKFYGIQ